MLFRSGASKRDSAVLAGKDPYNNTVHAPVPDGGDAEALAGTVVDVAVDQARTWYLSGEVAAAHG